MFWPQTNLHFVMWMSMSKKQSRETNSYPHLSWDITSELSSSALCAALSEPKSRSAQHTADVCFKLDNLSFRCSMQAAPILGSCHSNRASLWCLCFCYSGHLLTENTVHPAGCFFVSDPQRRSELSHHKSPSDICWYLCNGSDKSQENAPSSVCSHTLHPFTCFSPELFPYDHPVFFILIWAQHWSVWIGRKKCFFCGLLLSLFSQQL